MQCTHKTCTHKTCMAFETMHVYIQKLTVCTPGIYTKYTVCNALIKLAVFNYVIQTTKEKACTFYIASFDMKE